MHQGQSSTQKFDATGICVRSLGAGCSTRHGHCSDPPLSHLGRGAARRVDQNVTYGQVSLSVASPRSEVLSRPCQHKQRLATLCNTNPGTLCPNSSILSRPCQQNNDWRHCATRPRYALPQYVETQPPLSAPATTGNTVQHSPGVRSAAIPLDWTALAIVTTVEVSPPRGDCGRSSLQQHQY